MKPNKQFTVKHKVNNRRRKKKSTSNSDTHITQTQSHTIHAMKKKYFNQKGSCKFYLRDERYFGQVKIEADKHELVISCQIPMSGLLSPLIGPNFDKPLL